MNIPMVTKKNLDLLNTLSESMCPELKLKFMCAKGSNKLIEGPLTIANSLYFTGYELRAFINKRVTVAAFRERVIAALEDMRDKIDDSIENLKVKNEAE
jgi:hypothetical protein